MTSESIAENPAPIVSIVIPSYNARKVLADCLESIVASPPDVAIELIVVDDGSVDGTSEMVQERFPNAVLIRNETNLGYASSCNRAIEASRGKYIYLLNNDTLVLEGAIDTMVRFLEDNPCVGVVGSRVLNEDGSLQSTVKALPTYTAALFGARSIVTRLFPNNRFSRRHLLHIGRKLDAPFAAGLVSGSSSMSPRRVMQKVGPLDERFFYHVDADYCKRVWDAGWEVYYLPSASIIHLNHRGGSMSNWAQRFRSIARFHWGSYLYYRKHILGHPLSPMHFVVLVGLFARAVVSYSLQIASEPWSLWSRGRASSH